MKEAVVFLADGFEMIEAFTPIDYLRRAGVEVTTVCVPSATMNDPYIAISSLNVPVIADMNFDEFKQNFMNDLPDLVFCPGGMPGSTNLAANPDVIDFVKKCFAEGKYVSAICAAPAVVLAKAGVLKEKKWTCYPDMEQDAFATYKAELEDSSHTTEAPFVTDGNVITSRGAGTAEQFAMELVRLLCGEETAARIKKGTVQR